MNRLIRQTATVPAEHAGDRLDHAAAILFPGFSRSQLQAWIRAGALTADGRQVRPRDTVYGGEELALVAEQQEISFEPQAISLDVIHEDESILVINKPAGLVVHPGSGNPDGTVLNAILHHVPENRVLPRAGIVHRLDKDTTGLMVVAKSSHAQNALVAQLQVHTVTRRYEAVVYGHPPGAGLVEEPIARHPVHRTRMAVRAGGKAAVTHFEVREWFDDHSHVRLELETGRTHQIRVHMAHAGFPLVGDPVYAKLRLPRHAPDPVRDALRGFSRQALHAARLRFEHPGSGASASFRAPLPADLATLIGVLGASEP